MSDLAEIGRLIGKGLKSDAPSVNVHVPNVSVTVDAEPLAKAISDGANASSERLSETVLKLGGILSKAVVDAYSMHEPIEFSSELASAFVKFGEKIDGIIVAIEDKNIVEAGFDTVALELSKCRLAIEQNTKAIVDQTVVMKMSKHVKYDGKDRIEMVELA